MGRVTNLLILANVIVFLIVFSMPETLRGQAFESLSFSGPHAIEAWRWLIALFLHASASHLFFNMLGLYIFGKTIEKDVKGAWFLIIYFAAGLLGNLALMATSTGNAVGASGAVFGLLGAAMLLKPEEFIHIFVFPLPLSIVAVIFIISETFVLYFQPAGFANVATVSHIAGIIAGSLLAFYHSPARSAKSMPILVLSAVLIIVLAPIFGLITGIGGFILSVIDAAIGFVLYGIAYLISPLWIFL